MVRSSNVLPLCKRPNLDLDDKTRQYIHGNRRDYIANKNDDLTLEEAEAELLRAAETGQFLTVDCIKVLAPAYFSGSRKKQLLTRALKADQYRIRHVALFAARVFLRCPFSAENGNGVYSIAFLWIRHHGLLGRAGLVNDEATSVERLHQFHLKRLKKLPKLCEQFDYDLLSRMLIDFGIHKSADELFALILHGPKTETSGEQRTKEDHILQSRPRVYKLNKKKKTK